MIGYVYKIFRKSDRKTVYIGSTERQLKQRLSSHKCHYKMFLSGVYHYVASFEIVKYEDVDIILIKEVEVKDKSELKQIEGDFITIYDDLGFSIVNKNRAFMTDEQKRQQSNEKINCVCGGKYLKKHKTTHEKTVKHLIYKQSCKVAIINNK